MKYETFIEYFKTKKELPDTWEKLLDVQVIDPDGWDRLNFLEDWNKKISLNEFSQKANMSTCYYSDFYINIALKRRGDNKMACGTKKKPKPKK